MHRLFINYYSQHSKDEQCGSVIVTRERQEPKYVISATITHSQHPKDGQLSLFGNSDEEKPKYVIVNHLRRIRSFFELRSLRLGSGGYTEPPSHMDH